MYLTSGVDNFSRKLLVLIPDHFAESILDGRVVAVDEMPVDELHRQTRLACSRFSGVLVGAPHCM